MAGRRRIAAGKRDSRRHRPPYAPTAHRRAQIQQQPSIGASYSGRLATKLRRMPAKSGNSRNDIRIITEAWCMVIIWLKV